MDPLERPEVRWGLGCMLSAVAITGILILVLLLAIIVQPPTWLQVVIACGLVAGGGLFAWILSRALGASSATRSPGAPSREDTPRPR